MQVEHFGVVSLALGGVGVGLGDPPAERGGEGEEGVAGDGGGQDVGAELALVLGGGDHAFEVVEEADADLEVAVEMQAGGFEDGFADEDAAENGVLGEQRVVGVGDREHVAAEAMPGAGGGDGFGGEGVDFLVEDEEDEVAFVADVVEKGADAEAGGIGDAAQGGVVVAVLREVLAGGGEDALLPLGFGALAEAGEFGGG